METMGGRTWWWWRSPGGGDSRLEGTFTNNRGLAPRTGYLGAKAGTSRCLGTYLTAGGYLAVLRRQIRELGKRWPQGTRGRGTFLGDRIAAGVPPTLGSPV